MNFNWDPKSPIIDEAWMSKANIGVFERWQRRLFRIQGRCIFYFKKETDPEPCGFIPLIDIEVNDLPSKKGRKYGFMIKIIKNYQLLAKRAEYLICAENNEQREMWKKTILTNRAKMIVGETFTYGCNTSPNDPDAHLLLPYFVPPLFAALDSNGYKMKGIWTVDIPQELIHNYLNRMNQNLSIKPDDIHHFLGSFIEYLKQLKEPLLGFDAMQKFKDSVNPDVFRSIVLECAAPVKQFLKVLATHFKKVLEESQQNGVSQFSLTPILGPLLVRSLDNTTLQPAQARSIQDQVAQCFLSNSAKILEDVHQFLEAPRQTVVRRARVIKMQSQQTMLSSFSSLSPIGGVSIGVGGGDLLEATKGLLVSVVKVDPSGWSTAYTSNRRVGLIHESNLRKLSQEEENELKTGPNIDGMMDIVRERMPEMMLIFEAMADESMKLREFLE